MDEVQKQIKKCILRAISLPLSFKVFMIKCVLFNYKG